MGPTMKSGSMASSANMKLPKRTYPAVAEAMNTRRSIARRSGEWILEKIGLRERSKRP
jgi:hypothetical protein